MLRSFGLRAWAAMASEKLTEAQKKGVAVIREAKEVMSGDWEALILKATRPDDRRPDPQLVAMIVGATRQFVRSVDTTSNSNPYRVTLRKLWKKMIERDCCPGSLPSAAHTCARRAPLRGSSRRTA